MKMKMPWFKAHASDWFSTPQIMAMDSCCKGLYAQMRYLATMGNPRGYYTLPNGDPLLPHAIARSIGYDEFDYDGNEKGDLFENRLHSMMNAGVVGRTENECYFDVLLVEQFAAEDRAAGYGRDGYKSKTLKGGLKGTLKGGLKGTLNGGLDHQSECLNVLPLSSEFGNGDARGKGDTVAEFLVGDGLQRHLDDLCGEPRQNAYVAPQSMMGQTPPQVMPDIPRGIDAALVAAVVAFYSRPAANISSARFYEANDAAEATSVDLVIAELVDGKAAERVFKSCLSRAKSKATTAGWVNYEKPTKRRKTTEEILRESE